MSGKNDLDGIADKSRPFLASLDKVPLFEGYIGLSEPGCVVQSPVVVVHTTERFEIASLAIDFKSKVIDAWNAQSGVGSFADAVNQVLHNAASGAGGQRDRYLGVLLAASDHLNSATARIPEAPGRVHSRVFISNIELRP